MSYSLPHIVILGAGPSGLGAAYQLSVRKIANVTVLEQSDKLGGNAGSFDYEGFKLDYGSHRLHASCDQRILMDIKSLIGDDLLLRQRHGRIRIQDTWIRFPLKLTDLLLKMKSSLLLRFFWDAAINQITNPFKSSLDEETFASVLQSKLGRTACEMFYFPYSKKIWGLEPDKISSIQAHKRISANSIRKIMNKVMLSMYQSKIKSKNYFYYPRLGYSQISEAICNAALNHGAKVELRSKVKQIQIENNQVRKVLYENNSREKVIYADHVWSTIPITVLTRSFQPKPPDEIILATSKIKFRSMILIYLILGQERFSDYDAHYFPETHIAITRLSEPKNYSNSTKPDGLTALCAELPCSVNDDYWKMNNQDLCEVVLNSLENAKIPVTSSIRNVEVRRIANAYPIYDLGYKRFFSLMDNYIDSIGNLLSFGRQGLFAHDNTHHSLYMAYSAVNCLNRDGSFDKQKWQDYRKIFESHVVED